MVKTPRITMSAKWQGRAEPLDAMAARLRAFLTLSRSPPGRSWHCIIPPRPETPEEADRFTRYCDLGANPAYVDDHVGHALAASIASGGNGTDSSEDLFAMRPGEMLSRDNPHASWHTAHSGVNFFNMHSACLRRPDEERGGETDPRFVSYDTMRHNVLSAAAAFSPEWCDVDHYELSRYLDEEVYNRFSIPLCWMLWLSPAYAKLVKLPPIRHHLIVEPMTDGSLFMATGEHICDPANDEDLRKARALHRQIDHLNYVVPFNDNKGRSNRVPPLPTEALAPVSRPSALPPAPP